MASSRCILLNFDFYQKAKINFLQGIYDYTLKKEANMEQLIELNIMQQMNFLLRDDAPNVQNLSLVTTVRLCAGSEDIAKQVLEKKVLCRLRSVFKTQSREFRRNVLQIVKNIAKYPALTTELLPQAKDMLTTSLHDLDTVQKELVLSTLTLIANQSVCNAHQVMDLQVLPQIILCIQLPVNLALESTQLVKALCKNCVDISGILVDNNVLTHLADNLQQNDIKLIKQTLLCMAEIGKHNIDFSEKIINSRALCKAILYTSHCDNTVKRSAAVLLRELCKHHADHSKKIVQHGALAGLISIVANASSMVRLPAIMALGYMGALSDMLALAIIHSQGLHEIIKALNSESNEACQSALVWTLEQLCKHSAQHVNFLNDTNVFAKLLRIYISADSSQDLKSRCLSALRNTVDKCLNIQDIDMLLYESPDEILILALQQLCKIFPKDVKARRLFVSTGGLKRVQALKPSPGSELCETIIMINTFFPEDIVRYYLPRKAEAFVKKAVDSHVPQLSISEMECSADSSSIQSYDLDEPYLLCSPEPILTPTYEQVPEEHIPHEEPDGLHTPLPFYESKTKLFTY